MKIILVGATGTIGQPLFDEFSQRHDVVRASARRGDVQVDITSAASIDQMFRHVGPFDALVCAAGGGYMGAFEEMTEEQFYQGIRSKMMGQINLVLLGQKYITDGGSFSLITGILADDPIKNGVNLTTINAAVNGFVLAAAAEFTRGIRINAVCPGLVEESYDALGAVFPGHVPVPMRKVVSAYVKSVEGIGTGQIIRVYG